MWKEAQSANVASANIDRDIFCVPLVVPVKGTWDSSRHARIDLFWNYHCD